jgi:hypothetical protein
MLHGKEELLITFLDGFALKGGLISFYISNLSIEKAVLSRGDTPHGSKCTTKCSYLVKSILIHPPNSQQNSFSILVVW